MRLSPCVRCGACCAAYPVCFPAEESDAASGGCVPAALTCASSGARLSMKGTLDRYPRCVALDGIIGTRVSCRIYENRPSVCRVFNRAWEGNLGNDLCDRARATYGLPPFLP